MRKGSQKVLPRKSFRSHSGGHFSVVQTVPFPWEYRLVGKFLFYYGT